MSTEMFTRSCHRGAINFNANTALAPATRGNRSDGASLSHVARA